MSQIRYNSIGKNYNAYRTADPYLCERMFALLNPKPEALHLDIGCGTGNYTIALHEKGMKVLGVDPSQEMLDKAESRNGDIDWCIGNSENLDFKDQSFDGALASLTLHHWSNLEKGFTEISRVLKPGSHFLIFTSTPQQTASFWLKHYFPIMIQNSVDVLPEYDRIKQNLERLNFKIVEEEKYSVKLDLQDHFLNCGKHKPELYLNPEIRQGISSFSAFANQDEVKSGLIQLEKDIEDGSIEQIIKDHENDFGDYLFILAKKH